MRRERLLDTIPFGAALSAVWRLLLSADQQDEFVGDLVEEAHLRSRVSSNAELAAWLWLQTLRSVPALVTLRVRRSLTRPLTPTRALVGVGHRGLPLSVAMSVSAHALVVLVAVGSVFFRDDEVEPPRLPIDLSSVWLPEPPPVAGPVTAPVVEEQPQARRRPARRRSFTVDPAPVEPPVVEPAQAPVVLVNQTSPPAVAPREVRVPVRVAEKRCVSCPPPQLPPAFARLGAEQQIVVKTCVGVNGEVTSVDVLRGFDSRVSERVTETVRGWRLTPYSLDGHPVPFCYPTRFIFASR